MEKGNAKKEALIYKIRIRVGAKLIAEHQKDKLVHDLKVWREWYKH